MVLGKLNIHMPKNKFGWLSFFFFFRMQFLFIYLLIFIFSHCTARASSYPYMYTFFSSTLCSVAIWASRHSSQCYSAGSPCQSHSILKRNKVKGHKVISQGLTYGRQVKHTLFLPFNPITVCKHCGLLHQWFSNVSVGVRNTCDAGYK